MRKRKRPFHDLTGQTFGHLYVLRMEQDFQADSRGSYFAICKCLLCGRDEFKCLEYSVRNGRTTSCGCKRNYESRTGEKHKRFTGYKEIRGKKWGNLKKSADKRKIQFSLELKEAWDTYESQDKRCALSGLPISFGKSTETSTASLDRIDSSSGYVASNIQWTHRDINRMKSDLDQDYFIRLCCLVADKHRIANSGDNTPCAFGNCQVPDVADAL